MFSFYHWDVEEGKQKNTTDEEIVEKYCYFLREKRYFMVYKDSIGG